MWDGGLEYVGSRGWGGGGGVGGHGWGMGRAGRVEDLQKALYFLFSFSRNLKLLET